MICTSSFNRSDRDAVNSFIARRADERSTSASMVWIAQNSSESDSADKILASIAVNSAHDRASKTGRNDRTKDRMVSTSSHGATDRRSAARSAARRASASSTESSRAIASRRACSSDTRTSTVSSRSNNTLLPSSSFSSELQSDDLRSGRGPPPILDDVLRFVWVFLGTKECVRVASVCKSLSSASFDLWRRSAVHNARVWRFGMSPANRVLRCASGLMWTRDEERGAEAFVRAMPAHMHLCATQQVLKNKTFRARARSYARYNKARTLWRRRLQMSPKQDRESVCAFVSFVSSVRMFAAWTLQWVPDSPQFRAWRMHAAMVRGVDTAMCLPREWLYSAQSLRFAFMNAQ